MRVTVHTCRDVFLSTLSLRRATFFLFMVYSMFVYFYPRSPCGERPSIAGRIISKGTFLSTLSLRRATFSLYGVFYVCIFLSTLSLRRATRWARSRRQPSADFYPRSPCGERRSRLSRPNRPPAFLSTLSLRRATKYCLHAAYTSYISIHALLAESDRSNQSIISQANDFYPRSPCGERL